MTRPQNMRCILVKSSGLDDWWCIERAEHAGVLEMRGRADGGGLGLYLHASSRLGELFGMDHADIEGTSAEMLAIAHAIEQKKDVAFERCGACTMAAGVSLMSPRNMRVPVIITHERAVELAADIRKKLDKAH